MADQAVVWQDGDVRIVCMESMGHVDQRNTPQDVLVCGSHSAVCAVELVISTRPRGLIGHAAGPGLDDGGVSGLPLLDRAGIPGAAVDGSTSPIADGLAMYERGRILRVNDGARRIGIDEGMTTKEAAELMATRRLPPVDVPRVQYVVHDGEDGKVIAIDTIKHGDERLNGTVVCLGSHSGASFANYMDAYDVLGTITNDASQPLEDSATAGLAMMAKRGIPSAVVDNATARVGDGRSTYEMGVISMANERAQAAGVTVGMAASEAARLMLAAGSTRRD